MNNEESNYKLIKFKDGDFELNVHVSFEDKTVWLSQKEIASLFNKSVSTINEHIKKISMAEISKATCARKFGKTELSISKTRPTTYYNQEIIILVGKRVKSSRCIIFEEWLNSVFNSNINNSDILPKDSEKSFDIVRFQDGDFSLDVSVSPDEDTVWLTQNDIALLFETTKQNISFHIKNILNENELDVSVVKDFFTTAQDGKLYQMKMYNLDMIIAIGYRVNSRKGTIFRRWANSVLKEYLLKGFSINKDRCLTCTTNIMNLQNEVGTIKTKLTSLEDRVNIEKSKIIYEGELLDAYTFLRKLFFLAKKQLIIVDPYADKFILSMLSDIKVNITIITSTSSYLNNVNIPDIISVIKNNDIHGRYIFIDDNLGYILDNSINNIANRRTLVMKLDDKKEQLLKGII